MGQRRLDPRPQHHRLFPRHPPGAGQDHPFRILGEDIFRAQRPPFGDLALADIVAAGGRHHRSPHNIAIGIIDLAGAMAGQFDIDFRAAGDIGDAPGDILVGVGVEGRQFARPRLGAQDFAQHQGRGDMFLDRLSVVVEHHHRNAGGLQAGHLVAEGAKLPGRQKGQIGTGGDHLFKRKRATGHFADVDQLGDPRHRLDIGLPLQMTPRLPSVAGNGDHPVITARPGDGEIILKVKSQQNPLWVVGHGDLATDGVGHLAGARDPRQRRHDKGQKNDHPVYKGSRTVLFLDHGDSILLRGGAGRGQSPVMRKLDFGGPPPHPPAAIVM